MSMAEREDLVAIRNLRLKHFTAAFGLRFEKRGISLRKERKKQSRSEC
jgi:hypothetical protein